MGWQINSTRTAHLRARKRALTVLAVRRKDVQRIEDGTGFDAMGFEVLDDLVSFLRNVILQTNCVHPIGVISPIFRYGQGYPIGQMASRRS